MATFVYKTPDGSNIVEAHFNFTKTRVSIFNSVTLTAGGSNTTSSAIDITGKRSISLNVKLTNGATGPTVPAQVQIQTSNDGSTYCNYGGALVGGTGNGTAYSWGSLTFPDGTQYVQLVAGSNTAQNVTCFADISYVA